MSDDIGHYDILAEASDFLGDEPFVATYVDGPAAYFRSRIDNVDGNFEYLVLLHHQDKSLLEIFGNVKSQRITLRMVVEALHMLSEQWHVQEE